MVILVQNGFLDKHNTISFHGWLYQLNICFVSHSVAYISCMVQLVCLYRINYNKISESNSNYVAHNMRYWDIQKTLPYYSNTTVILSSTIHIWLTFGILIYKHVSASNTSRKASTNMNSYMCELKSFISMLFIKHHWFQPDYLP